MKFVAPNRKAIVAAVVAFCGALVPALADEALTQAEVTSIVGATVAAGYGVWRVVNADAAKAQG